MIFNCTENSSVTSIYTIIIMWKNNNLIKQHNYMGTLDGGMCVYMWGTKEES